MAFPPITIEEPQYAPTPDGGLAHLIYQGFFSRTAGSQIPVARATGEITTVAVAALVDGETFTLDDGENTPTVFEFDVTVAATGSITTIVQANLVDGETFTLDDGTNAPTVFEFDVAGNGVAGGNVAVDVSGDSTADDVRDRIISAVNGVGSTLLISASDGGAATVDLTNDVPGTIGNTTQSETVTDAGFVVTNMAGGLGTVGVTGGRVQVDVSGDTTANDVRDTIIAAINGNTTTTLNITASNGGASTVSLVNDNAGAAGNTTSSETVTDGTFDVTDMTGGAGPFFAFDSATLEASSDVNMNFPQVPDPETVRVVPQFRFSAALHHVGRSFLETSPFLEKREVIRFY